MPLDAIEVELGIDGEKVKGFVDGIDAVKLSHGIEYQDEVKDEFSEVLRKSISISIPVKAESESSEESKVLHKFEEA